MKKRTVYIIYLVVSAVCLVLMLLPYGVAMVFASPEGSLPPEYYPFFHMLPFGYAVFAPMICFMLTVVTAIIELVMVIKPEKLSLTPIAVLSFISAAILLLQYMIIPTVVTVLGIAILLIFILTAVSTLIIRRKLS